MTVVGYTRVSTDEQASEGVSLDAQRARVVSHAAGLGLDLADVIEDAGYSGGSLDRPGIRKALGMLDRGEADGLVIPKLDRLTRSLLDWMGMVRDHFGPPRFRRLEIVAGSVDLATASGRLSVDLQVRISQYELEIITERTADAMTFKRSKGEALGRAPFGRRIGVDGRTLEDDAAELATLATIRRWAAEGWTHRKIAAELNALGIPSKLGGQWSHPIIGRLLKLAPSPELAGSSAP